MDKSQYTRIPNRDTDSIVVEKTPDEKPHGTLRRKVSRAFSSFTGRSGEKKETARSQTALEKELEANGDVVVSSGRDEPEESPPESDFVTYMYPYWRMDPVLLGCFVCL